MLKKLFALAIVMISLASCASWFGSSQENPDSPTVGGRQDSSDMLFGQAESLPAAQSSAPMAASGTVKAMNASAAK